MFKKIEIWILYLVLFLGIPFAIGFGFLVRQELLGVKKYGLVSKSALFLSEIPINLRRIFLNPSQVKDRFPYLNGFDGNPNSNESYMLLGRYDGDNNEGIVELVDLRNFKILHTWNPDIDKLNEPIKKVNEFKYLDIDSNDAREKLLHPKLTMDGGLLFNTFPLRKIDACSNLIYQNAQDAFHHSIETDIDGNIWTSSVIYPQSLPAIKVGSESEREGGYKDDAIVKLSPDGEITFEKSVSQIFIDNGLEYLLFAMGDYESDPIHLNDVQPVDFDGNFWKKGDVFLSLRHQSMVFLYRPSTNKIIWKSNNFFHQHDVDILNEHTISVFDNNAKRFVGGDVVDGHNKVIIYNFKSGEYSSYMNDSLIKNDVKTMGQGRSEILPNGELFVEETDSGRILFFDKDGSLKWTYLNRADNGKTYSLSWSRILHNPKDRQNVKYFLQSKGKC